MSIEKHCKFCFTTPAFTEDFAGLEVCIACCDEWNELRRPSDVPYKISWNCGGRLRTSEVISLFAYRGLVRQNIIAAKVQGDHTAVERLIAVWNKTLTNLPIPEHCTDVMPCPSSLWSRLHGRIDIAWILAEQTARRLGMRLVRPPRRLSWRLNKRARTERPVDNLLVTPQESTQHAELNDNFRSHCLLIDDVVTTGSTIRRCLEATSLGSTYHFSVITFARSRVVTY